MAGKAKDQVPVLRAKAFNMLREEAGLIAEKITATS